jgi:hypothetical protein
MSYHFTIKSAGHLKTAKVWYIEGFLEKDGMVKDGSVGAIKTKDKMMSVTVKSMALSTAKARDNHLLTFAIEKPNFPMKLLQQGMIVEFQT